MQLQIDVEIFLIVFCLLFLLGSFNKIIHFFFHSNNSFIKSVSLSLTLMACGISILVFSYYYKNIEVSEEIRTAGFLFFFIPLIKIIDKALQRKSLKLTVKTPKIIHDIILFLIYFFAFFSILKAQMGIDLTPIVTTSAVVSMVIGLALQDTLTNFIAGLMIHVEKPFQISDWVFINNVEGKVVEINWRTTKVLTFDNDFLVIPNNSIIKNEMINYNYPTPNHILDLNIGVAYDHAPNKVKRVIKDVIKNTNNILKFPESFIRLTSYDDFSINYELRVWINDYGRKKVIENEILTKIWYAFRREGIKIPFPIRDVYHHHEQHKTDPDPDLDKEKREILNKIDIFSCLKEEDLVSLTNNAEFVEYGTGEFVFNQGDKGASLYIIKKGSVEILIDDKEIATLSNGNIFGEMSLFTGEKRSASVRVLQDSQLLKITKDDFSEHLQKEPELAAAISKILACRKEKNKAVSSSNADSFKISSKINRDKEEKTLLKSIKSFFNIN